MSFSRTVISIDAIEGDVAVCTPSGVDLPPGSARVPLSAFPKGLGPIVAEMVFVAWANLEATSADELVIERIEEGGRP